MRYFLISNNVDTQTGFRLAGIEGVVVHTADEVREALDQALATPDIGVILMASGRCHGGRGSRRAAASASAV